MTRQLPRIFGARSLLLPMLLLGHALVGANSRAQEASSDIGWNRALPGWNYTFPRDHFDHPDFKTEWWYFTGHLIEQGGERRRFGFQVTFFRQGARPPGHRREVASRFVRDHFYFGHFAVSDLDKGRGGRFLFTQKITRGAFDEAGADPGGKPGDRVVWLEDWNLTLNENNGFRSVTSIENDGVKLDVTLTPEKPLVFHGINGTSQKAVGEGNASHYYSCTRMRTTGTLSIDGATVSVKGTAWLDREWATNQLADDQVGWNWFSLQFEDGSELMVYQLRKKDGSADPVSSGTWISADGTSAHLSSKEFSLAPIQESLWESPASGAEYPLRWRIAVPSRQIDVTTLEMMQDQELALPPLTYWEGAIEVTGSHKGQGYMELTGYGGTISPLSDSR